MVGMGWAGCVEEPSAPAVGCRRDGDSMGEEKERRYRPMKKSSLRAQQTNSTVCEQCQHYYRK